MNKLKIAYFGSPDFSAYFLEKIITDKNLPIEVKLIITQPDKPAGRKQILTPTPVKITALNNNLKILEIGKLDIGNSLEIRNLKSEISQIDIGLVYAYAKIIPKELLNIPKYNFWNIHASLLPKYRGPSPIAYPLILGDKKTGVTIIKMDEKIDHGPIIAQEEIEILPDDKRPDLEKKLTDLAFNIFKKIIGTNLKNLKLTDQTHSLATFTRLLKKEDGFVPLTTLKKALNNQTLTLEELPKILQEIRNWQLEIINSPKIIFDYFRGFYPWPGVWTILPNGKRLKIKELKIENDKLKILRLQLEGKKEVDFETFNRAYKIF